MISYLLSGWRVFVPDANGHPLYRGRVYFYDASTSEPSAVYQEKEKVTSLGTYVDVDNHGFLPPIWLEANHLYKCVVKRLIQNDPETWQTLWEIDDVGNPFITSDTDDDSSTIIVNDITLLRAIDVTSDELPDYVSVAGWFNPGDTGSPMVFRWRAGEVHNEDGHWVKPNSSASLGTWEQILDDEIDPRKFGAIPDSGNAVDSALVNCMRYACEPHVQDVSDPTVYKPRTVKFVRSGTYHLNSQFDFSQYVMIPAFGSLPVPVSICNGVFFDSGVSFGKATTINSTSPISILPTFADKQSYVRTSWFYAPESVHFVNSRVIVIDDDRLDDYAGTIPFSGRIVVSLVDSIPSCLSLTKCIVIDAKNGSVEVDSLYPKKIHLGNYNVDWVKGSGSILSNLKFKFGGTEVLKMEEAFAEFFNTLGLPEGFQVDNDNFLMQPDGENEKYLSLKIKALLDITSKNGYESGIKIDKANISYFKTRFIAAEENLGRHSVVFSNPVYWDDVQTELIDIDTDVEVNLASLADDFARTDNFNVVTSWWWYSNNSKSQICQPLILSGANGKVSSDVIKIVNVGPQNPGYQLDLTDWTELHKFYNKSGNLFVLDGSSRIIGIIPPFSSRSFLWNGSSWKQVSV